MREIKFRIFDKNKNQIRFDFIIETKSYEKYLVKCIKDYDGNILDNIKIMQYTGLKDKNGKEIYEGDILFFNEIFIKVEFKNGAFFGVKTKNYCNCEDILNKYILNEFEIVGNIFENELLADKF